MSEPRIIKKYPNRRLYDTAISRYITLDDVKQLALDSAKFKVVDARTKEDITRSILLQIISEQEEQGTPIFTTEVLAHIIRFYGDTLQGMMGNYLEKSLQAFVDQQHLVREQMHNFMGKNPLSMMSDMAERNLAMWQAMNERLYGSDSQEAAAVQPPSDSRENGHVAAEYTSSESATPGVEATAAAAKVKSPAPAAADAVPVPDDTVTKRGTNVKPRAAKNAAKAGSKTSSKTS